MNPLPQRRSGAASWLHGGMRSSILAMGDIAVFFLSLFLTLIIRYGAQGLQSQVFDSFLGAYTFGLIFWLFVFYIGGLYERQILIRRVLDRRFFALVGIGGLLLALMFYFATSFGITPKVVLLIFVGVYAILGYSWRMIFMLLARGAISRGGAIQVLLMGSSVAADEIVTALTKTTSFGYAIANWVKDGIDHYPDAQALLNEIRERAIDLIVIPQDLEHDPKAVQILYRALMNGVAITTVPDFYERLFEKVSLAVLDETWLIRNVARRRARYQPIQHAGAVLISALMLIILSPILALIALGTKITSRGTVLYAQKRVGRDNHVFTLYKFRTMYAHKEKNPDADAGSPTWSKGSTDTRVTPFGHFLRATHLDELPQLWNIMRGDMSFVGPRPERPEFTAELEKQIPYYQLRTMVRPGIAGWAQLHFRYGASVEDAYQKLQYDIYYIKHRSLWFDLTIFLKTLKRLFSNHA